MQTIDILVNGNGSRSVTIGKGVKFITILNPTNYYVTLYQGGTDIANKLFPVPIFTVVTLPLPAMGNYEYVLTLAWTGTGVDKFSVILSETNLGLNQTLLSSSGSTNTIIDGDNVGLARSTQLPAALDANGALKTSNSMIDAKTSDVIAAINSDITNMVNGVLTVTGAAQEAKVGATALTNRKQLIVYPPTDGGTVYWGTSIASAASGPAINSTSGPLNITTGSTVPIYLVNDGTNHDVKIIEGN